MTSPSNVARRVRVVTFAARYSPSRRGVTTRAASTPSRFSKSTSPATKKNVVVSPFRNRNAGSATRTPAGGSCERIAIQIAATKAPAA